MAAVVALATLAATLATPRRAVGQAPDVASATLHIDLDGPPPVGPILLTREPSGQRLEACTPPCSMTVPLGHYAVDVDDDALRTAVILTGSEHRLSLFHRSRADERALGAVFGVVAGLGILTAVVASFVGLAAQEAGMDLPGEIIGSVVGGLVVGLAFGGASLALAGLSDVWRAE